MDHQNKMKPYNVANSLYYKDFWTIMWHWRLEWWKFSFASQK